jgi:hypothetical protein
MSIANWVVAGETYRGERNVAVAVCLGTLIRKVALALPACSGPAEPADGTLERAPPQPTSAAPRASAMKRRALSVLIAENRKNGRLMEPTFQSPGLTRRFAGLLWR